MSIRDDFDDSQQESSLGGYFLPSTESRCRFQRSLLFDHLPLPRLRDCSLTLAALRVSAAPARIINIFTQPARGNT